MRAPFFIYNASGNDFFPVILKENYKPLTKIKKFGYSFMNSLEGDKIMNNKLLYCTALILVSTLAVIVLYSTNASAQRTQVDSRGVTPETKCYNKKLKAASSYVSCLLRAERNANRNMEETSDEDVASCHERFEDRYSNAEAQASEKGASCPSHGGLDSYQQTILGATSSIDSNNEVKQLAITIDTEDLLYVMNNLLNLNIAVKVNGEFNVIWRTVSSANLFQFMEFQWSPVFQVFGAKPIGESEGVDIETNVVNIALGQDVVFGEEKILETPVTGNNLNAIAFTNNSGEFINAALAQQLTLVGFSQAITSIYHQDSPLMTGQTEIMTPTQEVLIWFDTNTATGDILTFPPSALSTTLDFTNQSMVKLVFSNMQWSTP